MRAPALLAACCTARSEDTTVKMAKMGGYCLVGGYRMFDKSGCNAAEAKRVLHSWSASIEIYCCTLIDLGAERYQHIDQARLIVGILETDLGKAGDQVVTIDHVRHARDILLQGFSLPFSKGFPLPGDIVCDLAIASVLKPVSGVQRGRRGDSHRVPFCRNLCYHPRRWAMFDDLLGGNFCPTWQ